MKRPLTTTGGLAGAALLGLAVFAPGGAATPAATPAAATTAATTTTATKPAAPANAAQRRDGPDFTGTVEVNGCSGAVVRTPASRDDDRALVMTNGHCYEGARPLPGEVLVDQPSHRLFNVLDASGDTAVQLHASKALYVTLTGTDLALYQVGTTYRELKEDHKVTALTVSDRRPARGADIRVVSASWKKEFTCKIDQLVYRVLEAGNVTEDVLRYTPACDTGSGTSGSPVLSGGQVVGINNTSNHDGGQCTLDNPCEMAKTERSPPTRGSATPPRRTG
ncbi:serine protease [Streptomyces albus subsp. chlorinus]|uniref:S1 family peptidase n=1 Tax=Streptomyces albus TaxID=1888 RepID=UPI001FACE99E|nr:serine protease [Streptomyces albus]